MNLFICLSVVGFLLVNCPCPLPLFPMLLDCWSFSITLSHKVEVSFMLRSQENLPFLHSTEHIAPRTQTGK